MLVKDFNIQMLEKNDLIVLKLFPGLGVCKIVSQEEKKKKIYIYSRCMRTFSQVQGEKDIFPKCC